MPPPLLQPPQLPFLPPPSLHPSPLSPPPQLSEGGGALKKTWNPKFTLRSHYDAVRGIAFHPTEPALLTASEDGTVKLWNLQKAVTAKKWVLGGGWGC